MTIVLVIHILHCVHQVIKSTFNADTIFLYKHFIFVRDICCFCSLSMFCILAEIFHNNWLVFGQLHLFACVYVYIHVVVRSNSCKNVVLRGCGRLIGSISYFLATRSSSQMNAEAANDADPKY